MITFIKLFFTGEMIIFLMPRDVLCSTSKHIKMKGEEPVDVFELVYLLNVEPATASKGSTPMPDGTSTPTPEKFPNLHPLASRMGEVFLTCGIVSFAIGSQTCNYS